MLQKKPYLVLWFIGALFSLGCFISYLFKIDTNFLLNIGEVYLVVAHSHIFLLASLWFLLCGFGYFVLFRFGITPIYTLTKVHLWITLLSLLGIVIDQFTNNEGLESAIAWASIMIFFIGQFVYFVTLLLGNYLKKSEHKK